ncbi:MAG: 1-acyl-sn-glycerol-3-phosphate acyltransferase [Oscillospiraceae bacterium]|jgi:1-acyl-sn-glycerol-3-phosphate acyltransferase|nr:1-acyl-sn-glycerol-3-phosphate acyltransferase [Oscillospiraceae bacterium]
MRLFFAKISTGICYQLARQFFMHGLKLRKKYPFYIAHSEILKTIKRGPVIFVCNHKHKNDQFIPMMAISRTIHTTPKSEYFTGEDVMFSKKFDKILLTATGGIRIDRRETLEIIAKKYQTSIEELCKLNNLDRHDNLSPEQQLTINGDGDIHIVSSSSPKEGIQKAIKYLNAGRSIFIFPEGTRNRNVDIRDLLPFHSGYANWAKETGALVAPLVLTGDFTAYSSHTNLILNFREPFHVNAEMPIDECHKLLQERIISGIEENIRYENELTQGFMIPPELIYSLGNKGRFEI